MEEFSESTEKAEVSKSGIGIFGHIILIVFSILLAIPLVISSYQYFMWIPIPTLYWKLIAILLFVILLFYWLSYKLRKVALFILVFFILKMCYNEMFDKKDLTFQKAFQSYSALLNRLFEQNPNLLTDIENDIVISVESQIVGSVDYNNNEIKQFANKAAVTYFSDNNDELYDDYGDVIRYFSVFKYIRSEWKYVQDPRENDHFAKASESLNSMAGDCDDYAILMAACIKAVGGNARIVWVTEHAFPVVLVANDTYDFELNIKPVLQELFGVSYYKDFGVVENEEGIWLNFDYTKNYPGGPFMSKDVIKFMKL